MGPGMLTISHERQGTASAGETGPQSRADKVCLCGCAGFFSLRLFIALIIARCRLNIIASQYFFVNHVTFLSVDFRCLPAKTLYTGITLSEGWWVLLSEI